jgi:hypothetical protein
MGFGIHRIHTPGHKKMLEVTSLDDKLSVFQEAVFFHGLFMYFYSILGEVACVKHCHIYVK